MVSHRSGIILNLTKVKPCTFILWNKWITWKKRKNVRGKNSETKAFSFFLVKTKFKLYSFQINLLLDYIYLETELQRKCIKINFNRATKWIHEFMFLIVTNSTNIPFQLSLRTFLKVKLLWEMTILTGLLERLKFFSVLIAGQLCA